MSYAQRAGFRRHFGTVSPSASCLEGIREARSPRGVTMAEAGTDASELKRVFKEALSETLLEHRDLLQEMLTEALEDLGLSEAIRQGRQTDRVDRSKVLDVLESRA